jgi:polar amino acid transport system permease protein
MDGAHDLSSEAGAMTEFSLWDILRNLLLATRWTIVLSLVSFIGGSLVGLGLLFLRIGHGKAGQWFAKGYIELFQGTPLLMQLFLAFFGLGLFGIDVPAWLAAGLALIFWTAAFLAEIWRGCVESIAKGQWEASASLGMGYLQQMRYVVLPQAFKIAIPPTVGFSVQVVKGTALTSIIGFVELSKAGTVMTNATFQPFVVYGLVALIYFALCWPLSKSSQLLERKLNVAHRNH